MRFLRPAYATGRERRADFWIGFISWLIVDVLASTVQLAGVAPAADRAGALVVLNVVILVILAFTRRFVALGGVTALGCALLAVVIGAPVSFVACLITAPAGPAVFLIAYILGWSVGLIPIFFLLRGIHRSLGDKPASTAEKGSGVDPGSSASAESPAEPTDRMGRAPLPPGSPPQWAATGRDWWDGQRWIHIPPGEEPPTREPKH